MDGKDDLDSIAPPPPPFWSARPGDDAAQQPAEEDTEPGAPPALDVSAEALEALPPPAAQADFVLPEWLSFLQNRVILGGMGAVVVLMLIAIVLVAFGEGSGANRELSAAASTPDAETTPGLVEEYAGRIKFTVSLRNGPGLGYPILGTLPSGAIVSVIGRNADTTWLQVVNQAGVTGWVPAVVVEVNGDVQALAVGAPGEGPSVSVPTQPPNVTPPPLPTRVVPEQEEGPGPVEEPRPTNTPRPTPTRRPTERPVPTPTPTPVLPPPTPVPPPNAGQEIAP